MTAIAAPTHFTPDDVLRLESDGLFELVDNQLVEKRMSFLANRTASIVCGRLFAFVDGAALGVICNEQSFQCFPHDPELIRRPDLAFISADRLAGVPDEGHVPIAPDIAIEVVSPNDKVYELEEKLSDYRSAGVKLTWVVNPRARNIRIYRLDKTTAELLENDELSGESVLAGFSILVKDLLPPEERPSA
ncbi:MAG TPA: Uma2 family endonuclease [Tepidisphaeraceae bacterium]|nr:Uma2 family endonuclease [Tepidisphaeraceae bacterium]